MYKHIFISTDGSELSSRAVAAGIELAKTLNAKVTGLFVSEALTYRRLMIRPTREPKPLWQNLPDAPGRRG